MSAQSQTVGAAGMGLVIANFWFGGAKGSTSAGLFQKNSGKSALAHDNLKIVGLELLFVAVATFLASVNSNLGTAMVVMILALWVLWAMLHFTAADTAKIGG